MGKYLQENKSKNGQVDALPSLYRAFETERDALLHLINEEGLATGKAVRAARYALERTGDRFAKECQDINLQRTGLWLLEMVKSGAGVLDQAAKADIIWKEVPRASVRQIAGSSLFYGAAALFFAAGFLQASKLTMLCALSLAFLRFISPFSLKNIWRKIPLLKRKNKNRLTAPDGSNWLAEAHISVEAKGFVDSLAEALKTADHVLLRLGEPDIKTEWVDDKRLVGFMQNLLEASAAKDNRFAMKLIDNELKTLLSFDDIEIVNYSKKTASMFDILPALDLEVGKVKQAAPALVKHGQVLRRGTVWKA